MNGTVSAKKSDERKVFCGGGYFSCHLGWICPLPTFIRNDDERAPSCFLKAKKISSDDLMSQFSSASSTLSVMSGFSSASSTLSTPSAPSRLSKLSMLSTPSTPSSPSPPSDFDYLNF